MYKTIHISVGGGRSICTKFNGLVKEIKGVTSVGFFHDLAEKMLTKNIDVNWRTVVQVGQPMTHGTLGVLKMEHTLD